jgi:hypothetical protein
VVHENEKHAWGRFSQVTHDGKRLLAGKCDGGGGEVFILDTADDRMIGRFKPVIEPIRFALSPDGKRFVYATGQKRTLAVNDAADGRLLHEVAVPAWEGAVAEKAPVQWMALSPDGKQAWACDAKNSCLHRFDLASDPPRHAGRVEVEKGTEGLMFSVDGRFLVTGSGAVLDPARGAVVGHLADEEGKPSKASNSMMALEVDAGSGRVLRTNQQCAPAWPGASGAADARPPSETPVAAASSRPVLIAAEKSDFKADLVRALAAALKERGVQAEVVALPALASADPAAYRAIVVVTLVPEWGKTKTLPKFLESKGEAARARLIVITTARSETWKPPQAGIDAITCASRKEGIGDLVASVLRRIEAL